MGLETAIMEKNKCRFNIQWTQIDSTGEPIFPDLHPWVRQIGNDDTRARCAWCDNERKFISITNSGISDLRSHAKSDKHLKSARIQKDSQKAFFYRFHTSNMKVDQNDYANVEENSNSLQESNKSRKIDICTCGSRNKISSMDTHVVKDDITRDEIYYALAQVSKKGSLSLFADLCELFPYMFKESEIAKKMQMHKDNCHT